MEKNLGSQRVRHDWVTNINMSVYMYNWITLLYTWNIIKDIILKLKKKFKKSFGKQDASEQYSSPQHAWFGEELILEKKKMKEGT